MPGLQDSSQPHAPGSYPVHNQPSYSDHFHSLSDPAAIGPNIAVMVLTLLYAAVAYLVLYVAETRMERRRKQN